MVNWSVTSYRWQDQNFVRVAKRFLWMVKVWCQAWAWNQWRGQIDAGIFPEIGAFPEAGFFEFADRNNQIMIEWWSVLMLSLHERMAILSPCFHDSFTFFRQSGSVISATIAGIRTWRLWMMNLKYNRPQNPFLSFLQHPIWMTPFFSAQFGSTSHIKILDKIHERTRTF